MKKIIFIILILFVIIQINAQETYVIDTIQTNILLKEIISVKEVLLQPIIEKIEKEIDQKKTSMCEWDPKYEKLFKNLIFIPIYNTQLKLSNTNNIINANKYLYYLELNKNTPINRIVILNENLKYIGTLFFFKDVSFISYDINAIEFFDIKSLWVEKYPFKAFIGFIKKQSKKYTLPIYFIINNFKEELFFAMDIKNLFLVNKNKKVIKADFYFSKNFSIKDIENRSQDTVLKYIYHGFGSSDTTKAINIK